jgi:hypothetical protein
MIYGLLKFITQGMEALLSLLDFSFFWLALRQTRGAQEPTNIKWSRLKHFLGPSSRDHSSNEPHSNQTTVRNVIFIHITLHRNSQHAMKPHSFRLFSFSALASVLTVFALLFSSCEKEEEEEPTPDPCANYGTNLFEAKVNGNKWCANLSLSTNMSMDLAITGIGKLGGTMSIEVGDLEPGTYPISEGNNYIYATFGGMIYESTDTDPGSITVTHHDTEAKTFRANFSVKLYSPFDGTRNITDGVIDVKYN